MICPLDTLQYKIFQIAAMPASCQDIPKSRQAGFFHLEDLIDLQGVKCYNIRKSAHAFRLQSYTFQKDGFYGQTYKAFKAERKA